MLTDAVLNRPVQECDLVFLDLETTGLDCNKCHIIEVAAVRICNGQEVTRYSTLIKPVDPNQQPTLFGKPAAPIPPEVSRITGITRDMLENAPELQDIIQKIVETLGEHVIVAHNAEFDVSFLACKMDAMGLPKPKNPVLDTLRMSRALDRSSTTHSMDYLKRKYAVTAARAHRALEDTLALSQVFQKIAAQIPAPDGVLRLKDVVKLHGAPLEFKVYPGAMGK